MERAKTWHGFSWKRPPITSRLLLLPKPLKRNWLHMLIESPYTRGQCFVNHHHPRHRFQNQEEKNMDFNLLHISGETIPCIVTNNHKTIFCIYFCSFFFFFFFCCALASKKLPSRFQDPFKFLCLLSSVSNQILYKMVSHSPG